MQASRTVTAALLFCALAASAPTSTCAAGANVSIGAGGASLSLGGAVNAGASIMPSGSGLMGATGGSAAHPIGLPSVQSDGVMSSYNGPDQKWGDPLSTDLFDVSDARVHLRYYSDVAGTGDQQGVGLNLSLPTN